MAAARFLLVIACFPVLLACNGRTASDVPVAASSANSAPGLPEGHPRVPAARQARPGLLAWDAPPEWETIPPRSNMRRAQYSIHGPDGTGECIVYYFGPGQGGEPMPNALRWADQFVQPDGRPSRERMVTETTRVNGIEVTWVDVDGTYLGSMTPDGPESLHREGYRLLGAIAEGPDAYWFFKFTGPSATVSANRPAFEGMIGTLRVEG